MATYIQISRERSHLLTYVSSDHVYARIRAYDRSPKSKLASVSNCQFNRHLPKNQEINSYDDEYLYFVDLGKILLDLDVRYHHIITLVGDLP